MRAGPGSSFFALWEPMRKKNWRKGEIKFYDAPEDKKNDKAVEASRQQNSHEVMYLCSCLSVDLSSFKFLTPELSPKPASRQ